MLLVFRQFHGGDCNIHAEVQTLPTFKLNVSRSFHSRCDHPMNPIERTACI
ncbi:hypothetical protein RBSH_05337 [Rhodopirellula baltica SH28]|uniref:Uncharacterized protein n=1 Tax=Rhodopirellula baltica SH28 TaxID=993517 RepID=K5CYY6_RHOBT|nr:hypothetical protein RBSH_05337 [Rhodopirellula baltica SH28]